MVLAEPVSVTQARSLSGPAVFLLLWLFLLPDAMLPAARAVAAVAAWMAIWWVLEAVPLAVTALLPIPLFPLLGVSSAADVTRSYAHHLIFLFLGGFMIALAMERWHLHRRVALQVVLRVGGGPRRLVLGFMLATAFLSMWISNTATAMMMVTIGMALLHQQQEDGTACEGLGPALMLGIGYAASIGGIATLIGTPPNAILAGVAETQLGMEISFYKWMLFALPLSTLMLVFTWWYLTRFAFRLDQHKGDGTLDQVNQQLEGMGKMSSAEKRVALVFLSVALLWMFRGLLDFRPFDQLGDSSIAIAAAIILFVIPSGSDKGGALMDWQTTARLPWDILLLFGGGFALASGFSDSGLTLYIADQLENLAAMPVWALIALVSLVVIFLTELTSNTATASLLLPLMIVLSGAVGIQPLTLMMAAALSASFAFMLPVATPPNAIVFASRAISISQMARAGLALNLVGVMLISVFVYYWLAEISW